MLIGTKRFKSGRRREIMCAIGRRTLGTEVAATGLAAQPPTSTASAAPQAAPGGTEGDWPSYNKRLTSNRFSQLSQIPVLGPASSATYESIFLPRQTLPYRFPVNWKRSYQHPGKKLPQRASKLAVGSFRHIKQPCLHNFNLSQNLGSLDGSRVARKAALS